MKKFAALLAVLICAFLLFGCGSAVEVSFVDLDRILVNHDWEECIYSAEISNGKIGGEKVVYTDPSESEMALKIEKGKSGTATITMSLTFKYKSTPPDESTPPYARHTGEAWLNLSADEKKAAYAGLTDTIESTVVIDTSSKDSNPVSVKKEITLETSAAFDETDKSLSTEFIYPVGKEKSKGSFIRPGDENAAELKEYKSKTFKNVFDNEQIYYMISAFMRGTNDKNGETALGYTKQYKIFNLADRCVYGKGPASLTFSVDQEKGGDYGDYEDSKISVGTAMSAKVNVSFSQGRPLEMRYSLGTSISIGGNPIELANKHVMLGYKQEIRDGLNSVMAVTSYTLRDYSAGKL